ncbi:MAG TPA: ligase-associated DNA damage response endonuclease PdeM [Bauldia sp.]|nr:ligase-associated DNA damage response endonuclease PdeM [Bauldia sp.]
MADALWQRNPEPAGSSRAVEGALVGVMGVVMEAFPEGALWWADTRMLVVADMHLEKGSSFAKRGQLVPPYDTSETLGALARLIARLQPHVVVALGDSFHDDEAASRLLVTHRVMLRGLQIGREWIWIAGNHDPSAPAGLEGQAMRELAIGRLVFRHEPSAGRAEGEIAGHLHPCARVYGRGRSVRRRCFAGDGYRLILPSFGAYTGGLDVLDRAYGGLFAEDSFRAFMLGDDGVYPVGRQALRSSAED